MAERSDLQTVVAYFMDQVCGGDDRPSEVVLALCRLRFPGRNFYSSRDPADLITLEDVFDADTDELAEDLWMLTKRQAREPCFA